MGFELNKVKEYWDEKAKMFESKPQATTSDYYCRQIEIREIERQIESVPHANTIVDLGCGNGYSIMQLAQKFPEKIFIGVDYSNEMIAQAKKALSLLSQDIQQRVSFVVEDLLDIKGDYSHADIFMSDRVLINITDSDKQIVAVNNIASQMKSGATYLFIENFMEGQNNFNRLRKSLGLKEIPVRWHNLFFEEEKFFKDIDEVFNVKEILPITSLYYLVTRVVYSKMCFEEGVEPDYMHKINKIAADLPFEGNYGPVKLIVLMKK